MPPARQPYRGADDLASCQNHFVVDGEEEDPNDDLTFNEDKVVKPIQDRASITSDDWPMFELTDVLPLNADGKIANLLYASKDGRSFKITGVIHVDDDLKAQLQTFRKKPYTNLNKSRILVNNPSEVSVGFQPTTLWIASDCGWLEVRPSLQYREDFTKLCHVIEFYFTAVDFYEELHKGKSVLPNPKTAKEDLIQLFNRFIYLDGSGATVSDIITACRGSKSYLLDQFRKKMVSEFYIAGNLNIKWTACSAYKWVLAGCPDTLPDDLPEDATMAKVGPPLPGARPADRSFGPKPKVKVPKARKTLKMAMSENQSAPSPPESSARTTNVNGPHHGNYNSPQYPNGIVGIDNNVDLICAVACHAICGARNDRISLRNLTFEKLSHLMYMDFSTHTDNKAPYEICNFYAKQVLAKLVKMDPAWEDAVIGKTLASAKSSRNYEELKDAEKVVIAKFTTNGELMKHRSKAGPRKASTRKSSSPHPASGTALANGSSNKRKATTDQVKLPRSKRNRDPSSISGPGPAVPEKKSSWKLSDGPMADCKLSARPAPQKLPKPIKRDEYAGGAPY